jgi:hypothetical protein
MKRSKQRWEEEEEGGKGIVEKLVEKVNQKLAEKRLG